MSVRETSLLSSLNALHWGEQGKCQCFLYHSDRRSKGDLEKAARRNYPYINVVHTVPAAVALLMRLNTAVKCP
jgi:hypothetical protein